MAFLEGDFEEASRDMGRALHYIQDRSVSKGWRGLSHDRREAAVAEVRVPVRAIEIGIEGAVSSPIFVRECILATKEQREPVRSVFQASMISAAVAKAVVSDPDPPFGLEQMLTRAKWSYVFVAWPAALGAGLGICVLCSSYWTMVGGGLPPSVLAPSHPRLVPPTEIEDRRSLVWVDGTVTGNELTLVPPSYEGRNTNEATRGPLPQGRC